MRAALIAMAAAAGIVAGPSLAAAQSEPVCDSYSSACPSASRTSIPPQVEPTRLNRPNPGPGTLPLTGGQLVGLVVVGAGAIGGGTALVVAGRRRRGNHAG